MRNLAVLFLAVGLLLQGAAAFAVQPDEVLDDPALEARARDLSSELRCMVCQNQSIDDSDAELAKDLRVLVRERLVAGDSDEEVIAYVVSRYGEFVLLRPSFTSRNLLLWSMPLIVLIAGGIGFFAYARRARPAAGQGADALSQEERRRIDHLLDE
ncbi:MAG: cytochrome c-type biogenesis protein [Pseudomonadota bacterium]|nr:cytochrome c-type biogenesis protein [Pseudomonadota bacterium]